MLQLINIVHYLFIDKLDDNLGLPEVKLPRDTGVGYNWRVVFHLSLLNMVHYRFASTPLSCRNLSKPIAVQSKEKEDRYVNNYRVRPVGACAS